jgi:hypothetical protein
MRAQDSELLTVAQCTVLVDRIASFTLAKLDQQLSCIGLSLRRSQTIAVARLRVVLGHAEAILVKQSNVCLCTRVTLRRGEWLDSYRKL